MCANRIYVQSGVYETFADMLAAAVAALEGRARRHRADSQIGPMINSAPIDKIATPRRRCAGTRAPRVLTGGKRHALGPNYYEPTVLADATPEMQIEL